MSGPSAPPVGVRLELCDGREIGPLPLRYSGRDGEGVDQWNAFADDALMSLMKAVSVEVLPAKTAVMVVFVSSARLAALAEGAP